MNTCPVGAPPAAWQGPEVPRINSTPKTKPAMAFTAARFRLIVDD
jgi:hypothetical protein